MGLKQVFFLLFCGLGGFFISCGNESVPAVQSIINQVDEEDKICANKEFIRQENEKVMLVARRYNWNLEQAPTGLFYEILNKKEGNFPDVKDRVQLKGKIYLQDGTELYNDKENGIKELIVNRSDDPVGLHELVKLMHEGEKARAIIPSYLAYGISGDGEQVPSLSFLICEIELVKIN